MISSMTSPGRWTDSPAEVLASLHLCAFALTSPCWRLFGLRASGFGFRVSPTLSGHGHEEHRHHGLLFQITPALAEQHQLLLPGRSDRDNDAPAVLELVDERLGHLLRRTRDDDRIERRSLAPALVAVAGARVDIGVAEPPQVRGSPLRQVGDDLNRID